MYELNGYKSAQKAWEDMEDGDFEQLCPRCDGELETTSDGDRKCTECEWNDIPSHDPDGDW